MMEIENGIDHRLYHYFSDCYYIYITKFEAIYQAYLEKYARLALD
jgi:hypothetical protein